MPVSWWLVPGRYDGDGVAFLVGDVDGLAVRGDDDGGRVVADLDAVPGCAGGQVDRGDPAAYGRAVAFAPGRSCQDVQGPPVRAYRERYRVADRDAPADGAGGDIGRHDHRGAPRVS